MDDQLFWIATKKKNLHPVSDMLKNLPAPYLIQKSLARPASFDLSQTREKLSANIKRERDSSGQRISWEVQTED